MIKVLFSTVLIMFQNLIFYLYSSLRNLKISLGRLQAYYQYY